MNAALLQPGIKTSWGHAYGTQCEALGIQIDATQDFIKRTWAANGQNAIPAPGGSH